MFLGIQVAQNSFHHKKEKDELEAVIKSSKSLANSYREVVADAAWAEIALKKIGVKVNETNVAHLNDTLAQQFSEKEEKVKEASDPLMQIQVEQGKTMDKLHKAIADGDKKPVLTGSGMV